MDSSDELEGGAIGPAWLPSFPVTIALVVLFLSLAYALTFGHMLQVSLMEQVIAPDPHPPRYAPHVHYHNPLEWLLIAAPLALGIVGTLGSITYLARRALSR